MSGTPPPNRIYWDGSDTHSQDRITSRVKTKVHHGNNTTTVTETTTRPAGPLGRKIEADVEMSRFYFNRYHDVPTMSKNLYENTYCGAVDTSAVDTDQALTSMPTTRPPGWENYPGSMPGHLPFLREGHLSSGSAPVENVPGLRSALSETSTERPTIQIFTPELNRRFARVDALIQRLTDDADHGTKTRMLIEVWKLCQEMRQFTELARKTPERDGILAVVVGIILVITDEYKRNYSTIEDTITDLIDRSDELFGYLKMFSVSSPRMRSSTVGQFGSSLRPRMATLSATPARSRSRTPSPSLRRTGGLSPSLPRSRSHSPSSYR